MEPIPKPVKIEPEYMRNLPKNRRHINLLVPETCHGLEAT